MDLLQAIVLGLVQGLGEFLPISSSGHLVLTPWFFGWEDFGLSFNVALHFGTLVAVIWYFWRDWIRIFKEAFAGGLKKIHRSLLFYIAIATIPGVLAGVFLEEYAATVFRHPPLIAGTLIVFGWLLFWADKQLKDKKTIQDITWKMALLVGLAQAIAIVPGVSRSGITIVAALFLGVNRKDSARFSFLLATPIILGASVYKFSDFVATGLDVYSLVGILVAAVSGYLAIAGLIKFVEKVSYKVFFWYRLALALLIILLFFVR